MLLYIGYNDSQQCWC